AVPLPVHRPRGRRLHRPALGAAGDPPFRPALRLTLRPPRRLTTMSQPNDTPSFDSILHPLTAEEFIAHYWEQQPLHLARGGAALYDGLFPLDEMDRVIAHGELQPDYTLALIKGDVAIQKT